MSINHDRLNNKFLKTIINIFEKNISLDSFNNDLAIIGTKLSNDNQFLTIYYQQVKYNNYSLEELNKLKGYLRFELAKRIKIKKIPKIEFKKDLSYDYAEKIDKILEKIDTN